MPSTATVSPIFEIMLSGGLYAIGDSSTVARETDVVNIPLIAFLNSDTEI